MPGVWILLLLVLDHSVFLPPACTFVRLLLVTVFQPYLWITDNLLILGLILTMNVCCDLLLLFFISAHLLDLQESTFAEERLAHLTWRFYATPPHLEVTTGSSFQSTWHLPLEKGFIKIKSRLFSFVVCWDHSLSVGANTRLPVSCCISHLALGVSCSSRCFIFWKHHVF